MINLFKKTLRRTMKSGMSPLGDTPEQQQGTVINLSAVKTKNKIPLGGSDTVTVNSAGSANDKYAIND